MKITTFVLASICLVHIESNSEAAPSIAGTRAKQHAASLGLPGNCLLYVYGMTTGGGFQSSAFAEGESVTLTNASGYASAEIAATRNNVNSFKTDCGYYVMGGFGATDFKYAQGFYGANSEPAATSASVQFTLAQPALVAVLGMASSQTALTLSGIPNLITDVPVQMKTPGTEALAVGHAYLEPGTYAIREDTGSGVDGQDPNHQVDLIAVLIFSDSPSVATSGNPRIPIPALSGPPQITSSTDPIAYYALDGDARDAMNHNHGKENGNIIWLAGVRGKAACLNGLDASIATPLQGVFNRSQFSISVWAKHMPGGEMYQHVVSSTVGGNRLEGFCIQWMRETTEGNRQFSFATGDGEKFDQMVTPPLIEEQWYHIVGTFSEREKRLYLNGKLIDTRAVDFKQSSVPLCIGRDFYSGDFFKGCIDELRIYDRALTADEVALLYQITPQVKTNAQTNLPTRSVASDFTKPRVDGHHLSLARSLMVNISILMLFGMAVAITRLIARRRGGEQVH